MENSALFKSPNVKILSDSLSAPFADLFTGKKSVIEGSAAQKTYWESSSYCTKAELAPVCVSVTLSRYTKTITQAVEISCLDFFVDEYEAIVSFSAFSLQHTATEHLIFNKNVACF